VEEITIIGAGPVGALAAIMLARRGHAVTLYEGRPDPRTAPPAMGRTNNLTLAERGWRAMRSAEVADAIREVSIPLHARHIHGDDGQNRIQPYGLNGESIYSVSRTTVWVKMLELTSPFPNIKIHFEHRCRAVDLESRRVFFDRPEGGPPLEIRPSRVIGADGAYSTVRRSLFRDESFEFYQRFSRMQYKEVVLPARNGAHAFENGLLHLWPRGECMVVAFPNLDHSMTASLFLPGSGDTSFEALSSWGALREFGMRNFPDLMEAAPDIRHDFFARPPSLLVTSRCSRWVHDDWLALIGDSAHALVPFLGQGLNAGLEDCHVLSRCVDAHPGNWGQIFASYEHERRENCDAVCELAEEHYQELARGAREPRFLLRKVLEQKVHQLAPEHFVPVYHMVSFQSTPYGEIRRRAAQQEALLDQLMALPDVEKRLDTPAVEKEIRRLAGALPRVPTEPEA
jgi:kynurenine 3-monooxygenase